MVEVIINQQVTSSTGNNYMHKAIKTYIYYCKAAKDNFFHKTEYTDDSGFMD